MNKNLLIEIYVRPRAHPDKKGIIATGYPVPPGLILTARHVLFANDDDQPGLIELRWHHQQGELRISRSAQLVWDGSGDGYDAALLRCEFPNPLAGQFGILSDKPLDTDQRWESEGFPDAGNLADGPREAVPLKGAIFSAADNDKEFWLTVDAPTGSSQDWKGASGSPVFIGDRIVGIICSYPENFKEGNRLKAVAIRKLMQSCNDFKKYLETDRPKKWREKFRAELAEILSEKEATNVKTLLEKSIADSDLADALLGSGTKIFDLFDEIHESLKKKKDRHGVEVLCNIVAWLVPLVANPRRITIPEFGSGVSHEVLSLDIATAAMAEVVMADKDVRRVMYRPLAKEQDEVKGKYHVPLLPECGEGEDIYTETWTSHLLGDLDHLGGLAYYKEKKLSRKGAVSRINKKLQETTEKGITYYFTFWDSELARKKIYERLKDEFFPIVFIKLNPEDKLFEQETDGIDRFQKFVLHDSEQDQPK
ncbi:MAG: trypsin-like peptidase domain-containing protein [Magnetococcales bacterium]|nr:trypsin-like peptidase domain-containing protein [Magnetococcales bacterium]